MVCRDFILPEDCKPCLFLSAFHFAKLIVPYPAPRLMSSCGAAISPKERKAAARLVQRLLKESSKIWAIDFYTVPVPERMKYASLSLAASALMQAFNHPEKIKG